MLDKNKRIHVTFLVSAGEKHQLNEKHRHDLCPESNCAGISVRYANSSLAMDSKDSAAGLDKFDFVQTSIDDRPLDRSGQKTTPGIFSFFTQAGAMDTPIPAATRLVMVTH